MKEPPRPTHRIRTTKRALAGEAQRERVEDVRDARHRRELERLELERQREDLITHRTVRRLLVAVVAAAIAVVLTAAACAALGVGGLKVSMSGSVLLPIGAALLSWLRRSLGRPASPAAEE